MRRAAIVALGFALLAPVAFAGDDEEAQELVLLPKAEKGQAEVLEYDIVVASSASQRDSLKGKVRREVKAVEKGKPSKEKLEFQGGEYKHEELTGDGGSSSMSANLGSVSLDVKRAGKARRTKETLSEIDALIGFGRHDPDLTAMLRRDPDGLARLAAPDEAVAQGATWDLDADDLLAYLVVGKATVVPEKTKARATLDTLRKKAGKLEAKILVSATIYFSRPDDPDAVERVKLEAELEGPADGSGAPKHERLEITIRHADGTKVSQTVTLERSPAPRDDDEEKTATEKKPTPEKKDK
jgi:hypothetical protein